MKLIIFISTIFFLASSAFASSGPIRIAFANEDFGNWHFCGDEQSHEPICETGDTIKGFNPEIAQELFQRLGKKYEIVFAEWADDGFFQGLVDDKYDVIISNVGLKDSRKKYGIFSKQPYEPLDETGDYFFYVLKGKEVSLNSVGTQKGSIQESYLQSLFKADVIKSYGSREDLVQSLVSGETGTIFGSFSTMKTQICAEPQITKFSSVPLSLDQKNVDDRTYIFTTKRLPKLARQIDIMLESMHKDGTVRKLFDKWLKKSFECD